MVLELKPVVKKGFVHLWKFICADDIDGLAGEEEGLAKLAQHLDKTFTAYGMEISAEKTKLMTNTSGMYTEIKVSGKKLKTVTSFKFLGSVITDEGFKLEVPSRIAQTTASVTRLKLVWNDRSIYFFHFQDITGALPCHIHLPVCLLIMDPYSRAAEPWK